MREKFDIGTLTGYEAKQTLSSVQFVEEVNEFGIGTVPTYEADINDLQDGTGWTLRVATLKGSFAVDVNDEIDSSYAILKGIEIADAKAESVKDKLAELDLQNNFIEVSTKKVKSEGVKLSAKNPDCSSDTELVLPYVGSDKQVRFQFIAKIEDGFGNTLGYKLRIRNASSSKISNVEIRDGKKELIYSISSIESNTRVFILVESPKSGLVLNYDGGSKGPIDTSDKTVLISCGKIE